ncbi:MAG: hypothetical protein DRN06_08875 [Thermoprotei archaeon]|nr:MAG: hypothetical protein DRN06_08875 [Thermoprotei archaeon]
MTKEKPMKRRMLEYLKENWGAPFILAFMALLIVAAACLSIGMEETANEVAVYAYYNLVLGVVLQLASYLKYGEGKEKTRSNESHRKHHQKSTRA